MTYDKTLILLARSYQAGSQWAANHAQGRFTAVITCDNFNKLLKPTEHEDGLPTDEDKTTIVKLYGWEDSFWCQEGGSETLQECMALIRERAGGTMPVIYNDAKELRVSAYRTIKGRKAGNKGRGGQPIDGVASSAYPSLLDSRINILDPFIANYNQVARNIMLEEQLGVRIRGARIGSYIHIDGV